MDMIRVATSIDAVQELDRFNTHLVFRLYTQRTRTAIIQQTRVRIILPKG